MEMNKLREWLTTANRGLLLLIVCIIALVAWLLFKGVKDMVQHLSQPQEITLEETPITIEDIRPRGQLYVGTALMEDYVTVQRTEKHIGFIPEKHSCVQMLKQKVSYMLDMEQVVYETDSSGVVTVHMPPLEYVASTQDSPFLSDDENYWNENMKSTNQLKKQVAQKIRKRFDTPENRTKAERYAQSAIAHMLRQMGMETLFVPTHLEKHKE